MQDEKNKIKLQHMLDVPQVQMGCTVEAERGELQVQSQEDRQGFEAHTLEESP